MKIIVTGGSGFLGSYIAEEASKKYKVIVIDKKFKFKIKNKKIFYKKLDISDQRRLKKIIKKGDIVFHLAAISDIDQASKSGIETVNANVLNTVKLLEVCKEKKIKKFIFASSIYVHSNLGGLYRVSKKSAELLVEEYANRSNFKFAIIRFGSVYGPRQSIKNNIARMVYFALRKKNLIYSGSKTSCRKFIHVKDVAIMAMQIINKKYNNKVILIEGSKYTKIKNVLNIIKKQLKLFKKIKFENITSNHYSKSPYSYKEMPENKITIKNAISLNDGIKEVIDYEKKK